MFTVIVGFRHCFSLVFNPKLFILGGIYLDVSKNWEMPGQAGHDGLAMHAGHFGPRAGRLAEKLASERAALRKAAGGTGTSAQKLDALPGKWPLGTLRCARRQGERALRPKCWTPC